MAHNPLYTNSGVDSCAFDPAQDAEMKASEELLKMADAGIFQLLVAHSTQKEIDHPCTPDWVKKRAAERIVTLKVTLTADETRVRQRILAILAGTGNPDNMHHLRIVAVASNVAFMAYGVALGLMPVWLLHLVLLPVNLGRLWHMSSRIAIHATRDHAKARLVVPRAPGRRRIRNQSSRAIEARYRQS